MHSTAYAMYNKNKKQMINLQVERRVGIKKTGAAVLQ